MEMMANGMKREGLSQADVDLMMWVLAWDAHAFIHQPLSIFDAYLA